MPMNNLHVNATPGIVETMMAVDTVTISTSNDNGEGGSGKYAKIENILMQIDDDWQEYFHKFKQNKMDDSAVFELDLFDRNDAIWNELMKEAVVKKKFFRKVDEITSGTADV